MPPATRAQMLFEDAVRLAPVDTARTSARLREVAALARAAGVRRAGTTGTDPAADHERVVGRRAAALHGRAPGACGVADHGSVGRGDRARLRRPRYCPRPIRARRRRRTRRSPALPRRRDRPRLLVAPGPGGQPLPDRGRAAGPTPPTRPRRCSPGACSTRSGESPCAPCSRRRYAASPYVAFRAGRRARTAYRALEDSLQTYVASRRLRPPTAGPEHDGGRCSGRIRSRPRRGAAAADPRRGLEP